MNRTSNLILSVLSGSVGALVTVAALSSQGAVSLPGVGGPVEEIRAQKLVIVTPDGRPRIILQETTGEPRLQVYNLFGQPIITLNENEEVSGIVEINGYGDIGGSNDIGGSPVGSVTIDAGGIGPSLKMIGHSPSLKMIGQGRDKSNPNELGLNAGWFPGFVLKATNSMEPNEKTETHLDGFGFGVSSFDATEGEKRSIRVSDGGITLKEDDSNDRNLSTFFLNSTGLDFHQNIPSEDAKRDDYRYRILMGVNSKSAPYLHLHDAEGRLRTAIGSVELESQSGTELTRPANSMVLFDKKGKVAWQTPE